MKDIDSIITEYSNYIYKYLLCLTHNDDISEELTQETMYKAIKNINQLKDEEKIEMWLCKIAKNLWLQEINEKKKYINISDNDILKFEANESIEDNLIQKDNRMNLYKEIERLDDVSKEIIYLKLNGDLRFKEIGEMYGKTENWARVTFHRAKQQIAKEVRKKNEKDRV